ncbi:hypothetical protein Dimus_005564, partial [Dionaea muscipula]
ERLDYLEDGKNVFKLRVRLCSSLYSINERMRDFFLEYNISLNLYQKKDQIRSPNSAQFDSRSQQKAKGKRQRPGDIESSVEILIVGAGVSGLTAALALHRQGLKSMVLESSNSMRASGFHLSFWTNAWKAFEEIGVADKLRQQHERILE